MTEFLTERLRLRSWTMDDVDAWHRIWADPEVIWWGANESFEVSQKQLAGLLKAQETFASGMEWFAITEQGDEEIVGDVLLQPARFVEGPEIGWHMCKSHWGRGYATEAAAGVIRHAFETLGLPAVHAVVEENNKASLRVTAKLGMRRVGELMYSDLPHIHFVREA